VTNGPGWFHWSRVMRRLLSERALPREGIAEYLLSIRLDVPTLFRWLEAAPLRAEWAAIPARGLMTFVDL
jgi:hypothetical protein